MILTLHYLKEAELTKEAHSSCKADSRQQSASNGALNRIRALTFSSGFLCPIVVDVLRRLKRILLVIIGLLSRNRPASFPNSREMDILGYIGNIIKKIN